MIRHYRSEDGISSYDKGDILIDDTTGDRSLVVRDGRGLVLQPATDDDMAHAAARLLGSRGGSKRSPAQQAVSRRPKAGTGVGRKANPYNAAMRQARKESSMYRQGSGWIVSTWDAQYAANVLTHEMPYFTARQGLADWRTARIAHLLAE